MSGGGEAVGGGGVGHMLLFLAFVKSSKNPLSQHVAQTSNLVGVRWNERERGKEERRQGG